MADNGVTYNSSQTYQHAVAHDPDVRAQPCPYLCLGLGYVVNPLFARLCMPEHRVHLCTILIFCKPNRRFALPASDMPRCATAEKQAS